MTRSHTSDHFDLYLASNFFDADFCRDLIAEMRSSTASPAVTYGHGSSSEVNERVRKVTRTQPSAKTVALVTQRLIDHRERVAEHFDVSLSLCEEPQFLCYRTGDFFVAHQEFLSRSNTACLTSGVISTVLLAKENSSNVASSSA